MADAGSVLEIENGSTSAPIVEISGEAPVRNLQTLKEPGYQTPPVMTIAEDSVFYSEDKEIPQPAFGSSTFMSVGAVWPTGLESVSHVRDLGIEKSGQSACGDIALSEEDPVHHSTSRLKDMENWIGDMSHVSSPGTIQAAESESEAASEAASDSSAAPGEDLLAVHHAVSAAAEAAEAPLLPVEDQNLPAHMLMEAPTERQSEQAGEPQERGESSETQDRVGEITLPASGSSGDELGVYSLCNGNGVTARHNISFNHLTHEKYGTVSYRQIRRGQTRQRIEEFESRMQM